MLHGRLTSRRLARTTGLILLALAAAPVAAHAANGRIAYVDRGANIHVVEPDGSGDRTIYRSAGVGSYPDWQNWLPGGLAITPDGKKVIFSAGHNCDCEDDGSVRIVQIGIDGGKPATLWSRSGHGLITGLALSPDGKRAAISGEDDQAVGRLDVVDLAAGGDVQPVEIAPGTWFPDAPAWSPDGTRIAYSANHDDGARISRHIFVSALGGGSHQLTFTDENEFSPAWSPDGSRIAYVQVPDGRSDGRLFARPSAGGAADLLYDDPSTTMPTSVLGQPAWSPDGKRIAFGISSPNATEPGCTNELRVKDVDASGRGTRVRCLGSSWRGMIDWAVRPQPGETRLISRRHDSERESGDDGATGLALTGKGRFAFYASAASNAVDGDVDQAGDVFRRDIASGDVALVSGGVTGAADSPVGTPDGRFVAFRATAVYVRDMDTGKLALVAPDGTPLAISADGRYVLYSRAGGLFRFDREDGKAATVAEHAGSARMSADGRYVAFESGDGPSLFRRDLTTGETVLVDGAEGSATTPADGGSELRDFSADGSTVLFASRATDLIAGFNGNHDAELYARRLGDAAAVLVTSRFNDPHAGAAGSVLGPAAISADGKVVAFTANGASMIGTKQDRNGGATDVWMRPLDGTTELVSSGADGKDWTGDGASVLAGLSANGRYALVRTAATDLTEPVTRFGHDGLYRIDLRTHGVEPIAAGPDGDVTDAQISADGLTVAYRTDADDVLDGFVDLDGTGADAFAWVDRSIADADVIAPDVTIEAPVDGGIYRQGRTYEALYRCRDVGGSGLDTCTGTTVAGAPLDTGELGEHTFTVTASDAAGNTTTKTVSYRVALSNDHLSLVSGTGTTSNAGGATNPSVGGEFVAYETPDGILRRNLRTGETVKVAAGSEPRISADGRYVAFTTAAGLFVRDVTAGTTRTVHTGETGEHALSRDGSTVVYTADGIVYREGAKLGAGAHVAVSQDGARVLYLADGGAYLWDGASKLLGAATGAQLSADGKTVLTGDGERLYSNGDLVGDGDIATARLSGDGTTVVWEREDGLYERRGAAAQRHVVNGRATLHALSDDGRFVLYGVREGDADGGDLRRADLLHDRVSAVASSPVAPLGHIAMSADGRRIAFDSASTNLVDDFHDGDGEAGDVYAWFDNPPVATAIPRITGPLTIAFDGSHSLDADGQIVSYRWDFGDGKSSAQPKATHAYDDEDTFTVKLTIEDDGSNEVTSEFEVVAIRGVLTADGKPLDFLGVDKNLRCSAIRGGAIFAGGGGECGTFVALGGKVYGPPELVDGVTPYTPVSQTVTQDGAVAKVVTVVALGDSGVRVRQTDQYVGGSAWYRTDVALVNDGDAARDATIYRGAHCVPGRALHDAGTAMAGCEGTTIAALLPLTPGAHHQAGRGMLAPLDDTCACDATDPSMAIGWAASVPAHGEATRGSLASFGPDGTIPLTVALKPDKDVVQPLDDNAFTVTVRNANGVARPVGPIVADSGGVWDYVPGSTTGLTTSDPAWTGPFGIAPHGAGTLRFGVTHRNGTRIAVTTVTAAPAAGVTSTGIADLGEAKASVDAHPIEGSIPNTAVYHGPTGPTNDPEPRFQLVASKDSGVHYECRFAPAAWEPCDADYAPGPLADAAYQLEVRAVDEFGADPTPATRAFTVDTVAPNTVIASGAKKVGSDNRPAFEFRASESGARFECRMDGGDWAACASPYRSATLADGDHRFDVRAIDAAGNADPTPATWTFRVDTTPPVTVIDGVTGRTERPNGSATAAGAGSTVAVGADGSAPLAIACPADGPACQGTVGLATESGGARAATAARPVPDSAVVLARKAFSAQPGETVTVRLALPIGTRNQLERIGRMAVFPTLETGGRAVRGDDLVLMPDPRTARLLDAGRELKIDHGAVTLRLYCAKQCSGKLALAGRIKTFSGRRMHVRVKVGKRHGTQSVRITTKPALTKRLTVTLRAKEARR